MQLEEFLELSADRFPDKVALVAGTQIAGHPDLFPQEKRCIKLEESLF